MKAYVGRIPRTDREVRNAYEGSTSCLRVEARSIERDRLAPAASDGEEKYFKARRKREKRGSGEEERTIVS